MPEYFTVLSTRYGTDALLAESHHILDLAFLAACWRYTQIVGATVYPKGLSEWPPAEGWFQSEAGREEEGQAAMDPSLATPPPSGARGPAPASSKGTLQGAGHERKSHRRAAGAAAASHGPTPPGAGKASSQAKPRGARHDSKPSSTSGSTRADAVTVVRASAGPSSSTDPKGGFLYSKWAEAP